MSVHLSTGKCFTFAHEQCENTTLDMRSIHYGSKMLVYNDGVYFKFVHALAAISLDFVAYI